MSRDDDVTRLTVSLPATQKAYVTARAAASGCSTPGEYVQRLIHADQKAREREDLERAILDGLDSPSRELASDEWQKLRGTLRQKLADRHKA